MSLRLYKKEKLCSVTAINSLFDIRQHGVTPQQGALIAYPLRMVWNANQNRTKPSGIQFLISIPKKKIRHAVNRVAMRRRVREAYRLNRHLVTLPQSIPALDIAFIYVSDQTSNSARIHASMVKLLQRANDQINQTGNNTNPGPQ
ncbi:ribonuclease P protein component [Muribaculum sp.]|jgi:ribonuclease P protein component|uniref:ribonuclease P protein component n=1 Tax=Muribaculum sp. TaxID=1918611 RepID=UPI00257D7B6F|nr:ribonuclease P protein component [Muribaculum sp.]